MNAATKNTLLMRSESFSFKYCSQEKKHILIVYSIKRLFRLQKSKAQQNIISYHNSTRRTSLQKHLEL